MKCYLAARMVEEMDIVAPGIVQTYPLKNMYPGIDFVGFLPVFESEESAIEHGGIVCALNIDKKEAE